MPSERILVYGGNGALGSAVVKFFKSSNWYVTSVDFVENKSADSNIIIKGKTMVDQEEEALAGVKRVIAENKLDAVVCVAGGWAGGNASNAKCVSNTSQMLEQSVWSSCLAAKIASSTMKEGGLLVLTGAKAALEPCPSMIGYGLSKAAVHHLTKSLAHPESGMPKNSTTCAILPVTLDTPMNRKWMPNADTFAWTPLEFVAKTIYGWATGERPPNGSLITLVTKDGVTSLDYC